MADAEGRNVERWKRLAFPTALISGRTTGLVGIVFVAKLGQLLLAPNAGTYSRAKRLLMSPETLNQGNGTRHSMPSEKGTKPNLAMK